MPVRSGAFGLPFHCLCFNQSAHTKIIKNLTQEFTVWSPNWTEQSAGYVFHRTMRSSVPFWTSFHYMSYVCSILLRMTQNHCFWNEYSKQQYCQQCKLLVEVVIDSSMRSISETSKHVQFHTHMHAAFQKMLSLTTIWFPLEEKARRGCSCFAYDILHI